MSSNGKRTSAGPRPQPAPCIAGARAFSVPRAVCPTDVILDGNEGAPPPQHLVDALLPRASELLHRYPDPRPLQTTLAARLGLEPAQVIVTAGVDDAIDRICRAVLAPDREIILPEPTFEMIRRYARVAGAKVVSIPWPGPGYPAEQVLAAISPRTALVAIVSPNNPTGCVARAEQVRAIAEAAPHALILVDCAYTEFADEDLTSVALELPNAIVVRTLSKAWGVAGLRVGYAAGPEELIGWLAAVGPAYAVAGPSLALAQERLRTGNEDVQRFVQLVRAERVELAAVLEELGARVTPSQANFVFARVDDALWVRDAVAGLGIAIRAFPGMPTLEDALRITCPGSSKTLALLEHALRTAIAPQALLFDMDGVLADVSRSYRQAVLQTARGFGVELTTEDVAAAKAQGHANNDWELTHRLLSARGVDVSLEQVTESFERLYQGHAQVPGLWTTEQLTVHLALMQRLAQRVRIGVVTGRPRSDAQRFLKQWGLEELVPVVVCMEDGPCKPDPAPVRRALELLGVERAWMIGDTPDDMRSARAAGVVPIGIAAPGDDPERAHEVLSSAGAGRVLRDLADLEELLP